MKPAHADELRRFGGIGHGAVCAVIKHHLGLPRCNTFTRAQITIFGEQLLKRHLLANTAYKVCIRQPFPQQREAVLHPQTSAGEHHDRIGPLKAWGGERIHPPEKYAKPTEPAKHQYPKERKKNPHTGESSGLIRA